MARLYGELMGARTRFPCVCVYAHMYVCIYVCKASSWERVLISPVCLCVCMYACMYASLHQLEQGL